MDDDTIAHFINSTIVTKALPGASVFTFEEERESIEVMASMPANTRLYLFLDIQLRGSTGWDFSGNNSGVLERFRTTPQIFILTAVAMPEDELKAKQHRHTKYILSKPLTTDTVYQVLASCILPSKF